MESWCALPLTMEITLVFPWNGEKCLICGLFPIMSGKRFKRRACGRNVGFAINVCCQLSPSVTHYHSMWACHHHRNQGQLATNGKILKMSHFEGFPISLFVKRWQSEEVTLTYFKIKMTHNVTFVRPCTPLVLIGATAALHSEDDSVSVFRFEVARLTDCKVQWCRDCLTPSSDEGGGGGGGGQCIRRSFTVTQH